LASVLHAYASVGYFQTRLFDAAYDIVLEWLSDETLDLTSQAVQHALIQIVWCFAIAGYHTNHESFAALLDYAYFTDLVCHRHLHVRRLTQLADVIMCEAPARAEDCEYTERIKSAITDSAARRVVSSEPPSDPKLFQDLRNMLKSMEWSYEVFKAPDDTSAFLVDISLEPQFNKKIGIMIAGRSDTVSVSAPNDGLSSRLGGQLSLAKRILAKRGWNIVVISAGEWANASTVEQQKALIENLVQKAMTDHPSP
jgi:hypothetical protein